MPVQLYIESMPVLIRLMHHLQRAYAHPFGFRVQQFPTCNDIRTETIKKRLPQSITPPQLRLVKDKSTVTRLVPRFKSACHSPSTLPVTSSVIVTNTPFISLSASSSTCPAITALPAPTSFCSINTSLILKSLQALIYTGRQMPEVTRRGPQSQP